MKVVTLFSLLAPLGANAHYIFNRLIVNGANIGGEYAYTRKNSNTYMPSFPSELMNSNDLRCNKGAKAGSTATYTVKAGDKIGFKIFNNEFVEHPGPGFVYISKAPGAVNEYDGSGDWVKVMSSGLKNPSSPGQDTSWESWQKDRLEWTIQKSIPAGEYLVRVEHIGLHQGHEGKAQFYIECYQLKIESSGTGTLAPAVKIPGLYKASDPGIAFNKWNNPKSYQMPGPALWDGN
ncbi:lytic polysaccharide monooxygenase [Cucurbitaria berberidis CBS 394.84]|uniref:AA9 family lytic polysaccharide monooxygenase n=1 Tax=Cucurbitaria berberidis CBS 394.84 TaxID=1168544 RepID=A0A9P4LAV3_9PLEO|nr:lytic polysaccharide monooxygenase [Cucurbitaria berberidis CBS 394.84]KAF1847883.1 lytic polysaccharide monooxygenase [Cucurbitaria berberidis CBS 394.84]